MVITLYWLCDIETSDRLWVGETAWMLSRLQREGYPIDGGLVVSGQVWREFLKRFDNSTSLLADFPASSLHLDIDNPRSLQLVAQQSRQAIGQIPFSQEWLSELKKAIEGLDTPCLRVQSSLATPLTFKKPFSSLIEPQICDNSPESLELAIKQIWGQLFSAKSLFYWQRLGLGIEQLNLAVLIQPLTNAIASGTATLTPNSFEIEATYGLGESLRWGEVLPDRFTLDPRTGSLIHQELGHKIRAYRLKDNIKENALEAYVLSPGEQEQYCLNQSTLSALFPVLKRLSQDNLSGISLEWILRKSHNSQLPPLAIAQVIPAMSVPLTPPSASPEPKTSRNHQPLLKGIAAAPGRIHALTQVIEEGMLPDPSLAKQNIIVTREINPSQLSWLKNAAGVITELGGMTSHAAILARELEIPAVVGVSGATNLLRTGDSIIIDGQKGEIYRYLGQEEAVYPYQSVAPKPIVTSGFHPIATKLMVNLSQPSSLIKAMDLPVDGVGLLRSELMLLDLSSPNSVEQWLEQTPPFEIIEQLRQSIQEFTARFAPRPVFYRSFDGQSCQGVNPPSSKDCRGTAGYQIDPTLFDWELQALVQVQQQGYHNLHLILPFVRSVGEFRFCRRRVEQAGLLESDGFQLWIMAEVPSVIFELRDYVKAGVQGVAIGTNDLVPFLLGINRDHPQINDNSKPCPTALSNALKQLIEQCRELGIPCCLCGQVAIQYPYLIDQLIDWGITSISVEPEAIERTYQAIARAEQRLLLEIKRLKG